MLGWLKRAFAAMNDDVWHTMLVVEGERCWGRLEQLMKEDHLQRARWACVAATVATLNLRSVFRQDDVRRHIPDDLFETKLIPIFFSFHLAPFGLVLGSALECESGVFLEGIANASPLPTITREGYGKIGAQLSEYHTMDLVVATLAGISSGFELGVNLAESGVVCMVTCDMWQKALLGAGRAVDKPGRSALRFREALSGASNLAL